MSKRRKIWLLTVFFVIFHTYKGYTGISQEKIRISDEIAVHCILGEARGEYMQYGFNSLLAVAETIRNRGNLKGVYGCNADFSSEIQYLKAKGIYQEAIRAWNVSKTSQLTQGATNWGSTIVDKAWIKKMLKSNYKQTYKIGNQAYFKKGD